jgi:transcriptional antiterminator RfaH
MRVDESQQPQPIITPAPEGREWVVLHIRPRAEKKAKQLLEREGAKGYLPLRFKEHRYGSRRRVFGSPLFPGYLFAEVQSEEVRKLSSKEHIANVLPVPDQTRLVQELAQIEQALNAGALLEVMPGIQKGHTVRITSGPLKGVIGQVEDITDPTRISLSIEMIQQTILIQIETGSIEPVDE